MDLNNMDKVELGLTVCNSSVKRKRKYSCSLDLFNGNAMACETVAGITESLGYGNNGSSVSADSAEELKEQDLIRCLMKNYRRPKYNSFVRFSPDVDCTLSLGIPHASPTPDEQRCIDIYKKSSMEEVMEVIKSTLFSPKINCSELEASDIPSGGLNNISSSVNNSAHKSSWSSATNATTTSNPISWFPTSYSGSMFMDSKEILAHRNKATNLISELSPTKPKEISSSNPVSNDNGSSIRNITSDDVAERCSTCHTTVTPLWRSGPKGAKTLCNACGIRYKKRERRAASAMVAAAENNNMFLKAPCSNTIADHNDKITAAP